MPRLPAPVSGLQVCTSGSVKNGPPSSGQQVRHGSRSSAAGSCTCSSTGARETFFMRACSSRKILFRARQTLAGPGGIRSVAMPASSAPISAGGRPNTRSTRPCVPYRLVSSRMPHPLTFSNSSAGPCCASTRCWITVTSRLASTSSRMRTSCPQRSSSCTKLSRSGKLIARPPRSGPQPCQRAPGRGRHTPRAAAAVKPAPGGPYPACNRAG